MTYENRTDSAGLSRILLLLLLLLAARPVPAQLTNLTRLASFGTASVPGESPYGGLMAASNGTLYGTTLTGGTGVVERGTVFRIQRDGTAHAIVHNFLGGGSDGEIPFGEVLGASDGKLYGTTAGGGTFDNGTVFKVNPDGSAYMLLRNFTGLASGGGNPNGGLLEARNGQLYGTTVYGGTSDAGTLFRLRKDGTGFAILYQFSDPFGREPYGTPIEASDGALYCTTASGGAFGWGTLFRISVDGVGPSVVRQFGAGTDGRMPYCTILEDTDLFLCGTTWSGGSNDFGTVFRVDKQGNQYTVLHHFGPDSDGQFPHGGLVEGADGALYGTTAYGGTLGRGTIFKVRKDGTGYAVLHSFVGPPTDGRRPYAGLLRGPDDALYGTTRYGGTEDLGVLFRLGHVLSLTPQAGTNHLAFTGVPGYTYELQRSTDLMTWATLRVATVNGSTVTVGDPAPRPGAVFYRLRVP